MCSNRIITKPLSSLPQVPPKGPPPPTAVATQTTQNHKTPPPPQHTHPATNLGPRISWYQLLSAVYFLAGKPSQPKKRRSQKHRAGGPRNQLFRCGGPRASSSRARGASDARVFFGTPSCSAHFRASSTCFRVFSFRCRPEMS